MLRDYTEDLCDENGVQNSTRREQRASFSLFFPSIDTAMRKTSDAKQAPEIAREENKEPGFSIFLPYSGDLLYEANV